MDHEDRLEGILDDDISIADPGWMVIGRQIQTDFGSFIDLLAIDADGNLIVLELKRSKTPRDVIAQALDYGSWVCELDSVRIADIFEDYQGRYMPGLEVVSLDDAFRKRFRVVELPETLNESHELVVVAASLDDTTERIVRYLNEQQGVAINVLFFRVFRDGDREYMSRVWFIDPTEAEQKVTERRASLTWNGEYYVSFGEGETRSWQDARKYGFVSAGGGRWYTRTLELLEPDNRIWVNVPGPGYVGVGRVVGRALPVGDFRVEQNGAKVPISDVETHAPEMFARKDDPEKAEYLVRVEWLKTMSLDQAIKEKGFFGNQNTVCRPRDKKWDHTVDRLRRRFGISD